MKIELAKHSGFCVGVKNAVNKIVDEINNSSEDIYINGPLIHSPQTVRVLEKRGLKIIKDSDPVDNKITAIRTHGTTRQEYQDIKKRAKRVINLTCSNVAYVQAIVKKYSAKGYFVLILGDKNHAEVRGISSYASSGYCIISCPEDITSVPEADKYVLVSQTTLDIDFFDEASAILKNRIPGLEIINTICNATSERQNDLYAAVKNGADAIVVVGGKNSANTKRLAQIGIDNNIKTFHIETEDELNPDDFAGVEYVVVSAGASTPSWIVNNVLEKIYEINFKAKAHISYLLKYLLSFFVRTNLLSAFSTIFMTLAILPCKVYECNMTMPLLSAAFIFIMYSINNFLRPYEMKLSKPFKYNLYSKYKYLLIFITGIALIYYLFYSFRTAYPAPALYIITLMCGSIYAIPSVTKIASYNPFKLLRILFGIKSVVTSIGWTFVALIIPFTVNRYDYIQFTAILIIIFSIIFVRNILFDLLDYQGDLLLGIETFPTIFGIKTTKAVIISLCILYSLSVLFSMCIVNLLSLLYIINLIYYYFLYKKIKTNYYLFRLKYESLIEFNFILLAIFSVIGDLFNINLF